MTATGTASLASRGHVDKAAAQAVGSSLNSGGPHRHSLISLARRHSASSCIWRGRSAGSIVFPPVSRLATLMINDYNEHLPKPDAEQGD
jgi:hypothetical protein